MRKGLAVVALAVLASSMPGPAQAAVAVSRSWVTIHEDDGRFTHLESVSKRDQRVRFDVWMADDRRGTGTLVELANRDRFVWLITWAQDDEVFTHWYLVDGDPYFPPSHVLIDEGGDPLPPGAEPSALSVSAAGR